MKKIILLMLAGCISLSAAAQKKPETLPRPKLVVGIVVDQMRWDYLYRYYDRYEEHGFKRFLREGFTCENNYIDYVPTVTAIGHSTIYTGTTPSVHGIAGNEFIIQSTGQKMYCTEDTTVQTVGSSSKAGLMSPRNLLASTITDELKLATNFRSKVIGISLKDRGSILPAGHSADAAYWFDDATGNWITSTYYMKELPPWVQDFNAKKLAEKYLRGDWHTLYDLKTYVQSSPDDNPYEGKFSDTGRSTLPVKTSEMFKRNFGILRTTPFGNSLTLDMAMAAVEAEKLGRNTVTDFLAVSFSSPDYIGHRFGINAIEVEDTYLKLDKQLAAFFTFLDQKIGKGAYTVFLTADHGAAHNPNFLIDHKQPAGLWQGGMVRNELNVLLQKKFGHNNLVTSFSNNQVHLNRPLIRKENLDESGIIRECIAFLREQPAVAFVVDNNNVQNASIPSLLKEKIINGYHYGRSGNLSLHLEPGWYSGLPNATGTAHGAWYAYDTHIPLLWMGWGIKKGSSNRRTNMTDIAPTLAALLHIQEPNGNIGSPIEEVLKH